MVYGGDSASSGRGRRRWRFCRSAGRAHARTKRADALHYGVEIMPGSVVDVRGDEPYWLVRTEDGTRWQARALLLATGVVEDLPVIEGLAGLWGRDVVACTYCHGWEARDKAVAVVGSGPRRGSTCSCCCASRRTWP